MQRCQSFSSSTQNIIMAQYWNYIFAILPALFAFLSPIFGKNIAVEKLKKNVEQWDPNGYVLYCPCSGKTYF